jgi:hypothetical protein
MASLAIALFPTQAIAKLTTNVQTANIASAEQPTILAQIRVSRTPPPQVGVRVNPQNMRKNPMHNKNLEEAQSRQQSARQEQLEAMRQRGVEQPPKIRYRNTTPGGIRGIKRFTVEEIGR